MRGKTRAIRSDAFARLTGGRKGAPKKITPNGVVWLIPRLIDCARPSLDQQALCNIGISVASRCLLGNCRVAAVANLLPSSAKGQRSQSQPPTSQRSVGEQMRLKQWLSALSREGVAKEKDYLTVVLFFWCTFRDSNPGPTD